MQGSEGNLARDTENQDQAAVAAPTTEDNSENQTTEATVAEPKEAKGDDKPDKAAPSVSEGTSEGTPTATPDANPPQPTPPTHPGQRNRHGDVPRPGQKNAATLDVQELNAHRIQKLNQLPN